jgi:hypothetical protein
MPVIEIGKAIDFTFLVTGGTPPFQWTILSGVFPEGLIFENGRLTGSVAQAGIYPVELQVEKDGFKNSRHFEIVVREPNLALSASEILASVKKCDPEIRDQLYLTVGHSLFTNEVEAIRDGKWLGDGSTFFSLDQDLPQKIDYYGYSWKEPQTIGLLGFHTGAMEEIGGWFTSLNVEYRNNNGKWEPVEKLVVSPTLPAGNEPFDKPHFVEYLLAFEPVSTTAIRLIGDASAVEHWNREELISFTSIAELSVHGALPDYEGLRR